ncbi:MAG: ABC transporter permease [Lachnospiraceae bacterium]|nr:ABC transporter permease [Lachnospiraceae bacterium]
MKSELSAWNYIKNNKKPVGAMVLALTLVFVAMYVIAMLLNTTTESFEPISFELPKKLAFLSISTKGYGINKEKYESDEALEAAYDEKTEELIGKLKAEDGISDAYLTQILYANYNSVFGMIGYEVPLMDPERIPRFLDHMEAKLTDGRMPSGDGEMLVDEVIIKNCGWKIGDSYMPYAYGDSFKIVGVISSPYMAVVGTPNGYTNSGWYIVVEKDESIYDMTALIKKLGINVTDAEDISDGVESKRFYDTEVKGVMDKVINVIFLVAMIFLAFSVLIAYISYLRNRVNEYCLYMSIGYSRSAVYGMIMREMAIIFGTGAVLGLIFGLTGAYVLHETVVVAKGLICRVIIPEQILRIISTYVLIMGILQIPVAWSINAVKTIDAIEE